METCLSGNRRHHSKTSWNSRVCLSFLQSIRGKIFPFVVIHYHRHYFGAADHQPTRCGKSQEPQRFSHIPRRMQISEAPLLLFVGRLSSRLAYMVGHDFKDVSFPRSTTCGKRKGLHRFQKGKYSMQKVSFFVAVHLVSLRKIMKQGGSGKINISPSHAVFYSLPPTFSPRFQEFFRSCREECVRYKLGKMERV